MVNTKIADGRYLVNWLTQSFSGKLVVNTRTADGRYLVNWLTQSFCGKPVINTRISGGIDFRLTG